MRFFNGIQQKLFPRATAADIYEAQLYDAQRHYAEHMAAAEHHAALAGMYRGRVERINKHQAQGAELHAIK